MTARQTTLSQPIALRGKGVHSNEESAVICHPAEADTGFVFDLTASSGAVRHVPVSPESLRQSAFCTAIGSEEAEVRTVEHLLAGLLWMGVDNVRLRVEGPEIPIGDGSALPIAEQIQKTGLAELDAERKTLAIKEPVCVGDGDSFVMAWPGPGLSVRCFIQFDHPSIGEQLFHWVSDEKSFLDEIAPARTFGFERDWDALKARGLARGSSLENTVVLLEDGTLANEPRFETEFVRHKILDLLGDMAVLGCRLEARLFASRPSHRINGMFVREVYGRMG